MDPKEVFKRLLPLALILLVMAVFFLPERLSDRRANEFGAPLFSHALPADSELIQQDAGKTEDGGVMAAIILKTELSSEALEAFYADMTYAPAQEGQTVTFTCKPLDETSLDALKQAKLYEEGASYQFVFLYSK